MLGIRRKGIEDNYRGHGDCDVDSLASLIPMKTFGRSFTLLNRNTILRHRDSTTLGSIRPLA